MSKHSAQPKRASLMLRVLYATDYRLMLSGKSCDICNNASCYRNSASARVVQRLIKWVK